MEPLPKGDDVSDEEYAILTREYDAQSKIGWDHFVVGKIAKVWKEYYVLRLSDCDEKEGKAIAFGRTLVESIWSYTLYVWKSHNEGVHGANRKYSDRDILNIQQCIEEMYSSLKTQVSTEDEWLFREESRIRKERSVPQILGWLERVLVCFQEKSDGYPVLLRARHLVRRLCCGSIYS